ncbi:Microcephalin [Carabus blaptoides fortunei]
MPITKDPCKATACKIQKCLKEHNYQESACADCLQLKAQQVIVELLSPKLNNVKKKRLIESPSAQFRRRCLEKLESDSSNGSSVEERVPSPTFTGTPVPYHQLLKGVIAYCEVRSKDGDRSAGIKSVMESMGATVRDDFTRDLTHVVFKDGLFKTFQKAKLLKIHLVSVLWLEAVRRHKYRVPETKYPALGVEAFDANVTAICQALQQDYADVVQDEYRRQSEIKHNTSVSSKNNIVTKKLCAPESKTPEFENMSGAAHITGSTSSANRIELDTPHNASPIVVPNNESYMDDVIPCSQDGRSSLSHSHNRSRLLLLMTDDESSENIAPGQSDIAKHVKDSFELKKALKIRSPESLLGRKLASKSLDENRNSLEDELSMRLHITTDESNINSTGSKSRSSSLNAQTEIGSKSASELDKCQKSKRKYVRRMTLGATGINNLKSLTDMEDSKETKASASTSTSMKEKSLDNSNSPVGNKESKKTEKTTTPNINIIKNRRTTRFGHNISIAASDNVDIQGTIISELSKSKPVLQNEYVSKKQESPCSPNKNKTAAKGDSDNQNKEKNTNEQPIVKPRLRKLYKENFDDLTRFHFLDQPVKSNEQNENEPVKSKRKYCVPLPEGFELTKTLSNKARAASVKKSSAPKNTGAIKKTRQTVTKLMFTSSSSDDNHGRNISLGSDDIFEPNVESAKTRKSPRRITEASKQVIQMEPISTAKKQSPQKRTINRKAIPELASDSEDAFKPVNPEKKRRKSFTTDDETSSDESDRPIQSSFTPRRSMRLNTSKITNINEHNDSSQTSGSPVRRSSRRTIHNSQPNKTPSGTPNLRKQLLTSKTPKKSGSSSDEIKEKSERRSTLEFVQRPSRKSLERIKLTQKSKHVIKLCSIVCTRLHKGDVQVFQQIVKKLGGFVIEDEVTERTTHLVAGAASRTINMLRAIARGCWIIRQEWLFKSLEAGRWLEEEEFELIEFSPAVQKCRLQRKSFGPLYSLDIFKECGPIHVCKSSNPRCSDLEELLSLCGGNVVKTPRLAKIIVGDYFRYDNTFCVNEKWILDCITHNRKKSVKGYLLEPRYSSSSQ